MSADGTLVTENVRLSVLTGTDSQESTEVVEKLPNWNGRTGIVGVQFG